MKSKIRLSSAQLGLGAGSELGNNQPPVGLKLGLGLSLSKNNSRNESQSIFIFIYIIDEH